MSEHKTIGRMGVPDRDWMRICFAAGAVVHSTPAQCWFCKQIRPPVQHINITASAAGSVPSTFRPVCQECANA